VNRLKLTAAAILLCGLQVTLVSATLGRCNAFQSDLWQRLDAGYFSIPAPSGWQFKKLQGIDSYVGKFEGDGVRLDFDFGAYSNPLDEAKSPTYLISEEFVGGFRAKIVCPKKSGHGVTGIYFPALGHNNKLTVEGRNLDVAQRDLVLKMLRGIIFR
jgi:hypothetical protein